ncbi:hypothetical protein HY631_02035 [Candidatus Uhrbacteria bacterium]|nr:hypothetical protein [Candidatus Uhrbacteria bacterium]
MSFVPYIGVTGFVSREEVDAAVSTLDALPAWSDRRLMVGVLVNSKTLRGVRHARPFRYPLIERVAGLFHPHRRAVNLIHYATDDPQALSVQLEELVYRGGKHLDGFQLNQCWPDPRTIRLPKGLRVVLQIGSHALSEVQKDPDLLSQRLSEYSGVVTDVLIDDSGGRGIPMDARLANDYVRAIFLEHPQLGIGVAGGLCAQSLRSLQALVNRFPTLSVDAEGRLRTPEDHLDLEEMRRYIVVADKLFDH